MIDLHCHVLPGIDDGPETFDGSVALARAAAAAGTRTIVATPHVNRLYSNEPTTIARLADELNDRLIDEGVALAVLTGAEIALTRVGEHNDAELSRLALGEGGWLLVEPPFTSVATNLDAILLDLKARGHRILLAHPERCAAFRSHPQMLGSLVRDGLLTSVTAGSLIGQFGKEAQRFAVALAREGMLHNVASDAHDHAGRPPEMAGALERAGLGSLTAWLTQEVPAAILAGQEVIPPRPSADVSMLEPRTRRRLRVPGR